MLMANGLERKCENVKVIYSFLAQHSRQILPIAWGGAEAGRIA
jgi:hypothetical protein